MVDGYRLPPVQFSYKEAAALITADKLIELHTDKSLDQDYKSALFKIKSILRQTDKEYLQALEDNIQVLPNPYLPVKKISNTRQVIYSRLSKPLHIKNNPAQL